MKKIHTHSTRGFIALMSAIIISSVLILMMVSVSTSSFFARADSSRGEYKRISLGLAESCTNISILKVVEDFSYNIVNDPQYKVIPHNLSEMGVEVPVGSDFCYITDLILDPAEDINHRKHATTTVQAEYNGAFSNVTTVFTIQNPDKGITVLPPTCNLQASPAQVPVGKNVTLQWSATSNATNMSLDHGIGVVTPAVSGTYTVSGVSGNGVITYTATVSNAGGSTQCTASVTVVPPPPAPDCADVVMMLDRSGSMFNNSADIPNEQNAATGLLNKYLDPLLNLNPLPKVGVGRFGQAEYDALHNELNCSISPPASSKCGKSADLVAQLSNISSYASAFSAIANGLWNNHSWTNIADAIRIADVELNNTTRHTLGKKKGIIIVSDGGTNQPATNNPTGNNYQDAANAAALAKSGTMTLPSYKSADGIGTQIFAVHFGSVGSVSTKYPGFSGNDQDYLASLATASANDHVVDTNTGAKPATQTHAPSNWSGGGVSGMTSDGAFTTSSVGNQQQAYAAFGVPVAAGFTIKGLQLGIDGLVTGSVTNSTATLLPVAQGAQTAWTNGVAAVSEAGTANCGTTPNSLITNAANARESVTVNIASVPLGSTITSVDVSSYDKADSSAGGTYKTFTAINGVTTDATTNLTAATTGGATLCNGVKTQNIDVPDVVKAAGTTLEIGVVKQNAGGSSNNAVRVGALRVVVNYASPAASCQVGVNVSWDNGGTWSSTKTITLLGTQGIVTAGNGTDTWGHTWVSGAGGETSDANFVARVTNTTCTGSSVAKVDGVTARFYYGGVDAAAENADGDHFFIAPTSADIPQLFTTIGVLLCPAAAPACSNTIDDDLDTKIDAADPSCHTDGDATNAASYDPNKNDEWTAPAIPPPPPAPPSPPNVNIGSWQEKPVLLAP